MAASRNSRSTDLAERVGAFVAARIAPEEPVWIGLSGGCDSIVLLHLLSRLGLHGRLNAVHVHHGLSPNADHWAAFCSKTCAALGVPITVRHVEVDPASGLGLEAAARQARYAAFSSVAKSCLLLAQHRGDQAETLLFNLLRGTGVAGAAAMPVERRLKVGIRLLRPLLDTSRAEIEAYAQGHGLSWIDDESNSDTGFSRNFLRHEVLTAVSQRFPAAEANLALAAAHFGEVSGLLDQLAEMDWQRVAEGDAARLREVRELSAARLKNLLRFRLRHLAWRVPVAARLEEFCRQVLEAGPDRHPELRLPDGVMRVGGGLLRWLR